MSSGSLKDRFRKATLLHRAGALEQAEAIYRDLLRVDRTYANAWHRLGLVFYARRKLGEAAEHIEKALAIHDGNAVHWNNYGAVLKDRGERQEALIAFGKAVRLCPDYADAWSNLGLMQAEQGLLEEAEESIRHALRLEPRHGDALCHLAVICREKGQASEALQACRAAMSVDPKNADSHDIAGSVLARLERFDEAIAAYGEASVLDPASPNPHLGLGFAYSDMDDVNNARTAFQTAAALRPDLRTWRLRHLGLCPAVFSSESDISEYRSNLESQLDQALAEAPAFDWRCVLSDGVYPSFHLSFHGHCNRQIKEKFAKLYCTAFPGERRDAPRRARIRVGFLCSGRHERGFVRGFGGIMARLDPTRFEVVGIVTRDVVNFCQKNVASPELSWVGIPRHLERAWRIIQDLQCDIVVHWHAGSDALNYFLPYLPLAPVQCIAFGANGTTGIPNIDYFASSDLFERGEEANEDYSEQLVRFDGLTTWQNRVPETQPAARADFGLPASGTLYFCPQQVGKFHPRFDGVLRRILERDATCHIVALNGGRRCSL